MASGILAETFSDKLTSDDREPSFTFTIPIVDGTFGLLAPSLSFWVQLVVLLLLQTAACAVFGVIMYKFIVARRGRMESYLVGYGAIIPVALAFPFVTIKHLDIQNVMIRFGLFLPTLVTFRCLEAMHCSAPIAELTAGNYVIYCCCLVEVLYDPKTKVPMKLKESELIRNMTRILTQLVLLSLLYSCVVQHSFAPFDAPKAAHNMDHSLPDMLHLGHLGNNLVGAYLMFLCLSFGQSAVGFAVNLLGVKTIDVMRSPLTKSTSPTDFWSRRWNQVIHSLLKRGIFKPMIQAFPRAVAVGATFLVSGLLHEYVWSFLFFQHDDVERFYPLHGKSMLFFTYNGVVMMVENLIGHWPVFQFIKKSFPTPIIAMLVIFTALPCGHLFTGDLIEGGYFYDFAVALPLIVRVI